MTPERMAKIHAACFTKHPRPWSAAEIARLLDQIGVEALHAPNGFAITRKIADEAELLTIAVAPEAQRQGIARRLLNQAHQTLAAQDVAQIFLEVAEDNAPAHALYTGCGYRETGRRRDYYGAGNSALILMRPLSPDGA
ncbi:ribosomal protein S18-alanine N-acetyltransferase [Paracoccaceae bacterium GXU_MW_L88]